MIYCLHKLAKIASSPGNPATYASINVFDGLFSSVSIRFWLCSSQKMVISRPPGPRAFGLASACIYWAPAAAPMLSTVTAVGSAFDDKPMGGGCHYPRGSDCQTYPDRDDSFTFKNRSESWCAGLGQVYSRRKDVPKGGVRQLVET
jgi:hypothetical protein